MPSKSVNVEVEGRSLKLSNLDKVLYPETGFTKAEVIAHYQAVAPAMLPHLQGRALTFTRYPDGVEAQSFFAKRAPTYTPEWMRTTTVRHDSAGEVPYVMIDDLPGMMWAANLAALEIHTPLHRADEPNRPTTAVFDLDPGAPAALLECCDVALLLRDTLDSLGLRLYPKTSGSKGIQVFLPLNNPAITYEESRAFSQAIALLLSRAHPDTVLANMSKERRVGKIFIDWYQNHSQKTTISPYSLRATARPGVSSPLTWDEVEQAAAKRDAEHLRFSPAEVAGRLQANGDEMAALLTMEQALPTL